MASKAVEPMIEYAFSTLDIIRIFTGVFEHNIASQRVLEKNGFTMEGVFEKAIIKNIRIMNEVRYGLIKS